MARNGRRRQNLVNNRVHFSSNHFQSLNYEANVGQKLFFYCQCLFHGDDGGCGADQHSMSCARERIALWGNWHSKWRLRLWWINKNVIYAQLHAHTVLIIKTFPPLPLLFRSSFDGSLIASFRACKICCDRQLRSEWQEAKNLDEKSRSSRRNHRSMEDFIDINSAEKNSEVNLCTPQCGIA